MDDKCHQFTLQSFHHFLAEFTRLHHAIVTKSQFQPIPFGVILQFLRKFPIKNPFLKVFQKLLRKSIILETIVEKEVTCHDFVSILNTCSITLKETIIQDYDGNYEKFEVALYQYLQEA